MGLIKLLTDLNSFYQNNPFSQQFSGGSQYATPPAAIAKGIFDQKSLKYGNDRPGGGSSNEPYITTSIPDGYVGNSPDFLLRGGLLNPELVKRDVSRLTNLFTDTKSSRGFLFITKQQLLERQNVIFPGSPGRIYNPAGTIAQAGVLGIGYHLNKQGLNPFSVGYFNGGKDGYYYFTKERNTIDQSVVGGENRLVLLYNTKQVSKTENINISTGNILYNISDNNELLFSYPGGPNSIAGIGKTNIRIYSDRTGLIPDIVKNNPKYLVGSAPNWIYNPSFGGNGVSIQYTADTNSDEEEIYESLYTSNPQNILNRNIEPEGILNDKNDSNNNIYTFSGQQIINQVPKSKTKTTFLNSITDYRATINESQETNVLPQTQYNIFNRENTYDTAVTQYKINRDPLNPNLSYNFDGINKLDILQGNSNDFIDTQNKDLIKFYFEINNNGAETNTQNWFLFFRAYINDLSDNFQSEWQSYKYSGRGENFYRYSGFTRNIQLSFTVYAHSREEMLPIYNKLNYLIGTTTPDYSNIGLMRGNFINLTVGDYLNSVPGIINNISLKPSFDAGWDINRDENGNVLGLDNNIGQLPKMIDINLSFTPIHSFTPQFKKSFIRNES